MTGLTLPFWIVTEHRHILNPPTRTPCDDPFAPHAFTTTQRLTAFLDARKRGRWDVNLVDDENAVLLVVTDAKERGATHICFDPEVDGSGGELISIVDVLAAFDGEGK